MVDPEFERKHPRDPADGRFTDNPGSAWAQRISDSIASGMSPNAAHAAAMDAAAADRLSTIRDALPDFPPDGLRLQAVEVGTRAHKWASEPYHDPDADPYFDGLEFWDPINTLWRDGSDAYWSEKEQVLYLDDPEENLQDVSWTAHAPVYVRTLQQVEEHHAIPMNGDQPDPGKEYLHEDSGWWIPGEELVVIDNPWDDGQTKIWHHPDWELEYNQVEIAQRPHTLPNEHFEKRPLSPDERRGAFGGARVVRALDLIEHKQYQNGYYQVWHGGAWHTIEEVYQDDPDQEVMELIADGLHLPALDTSDELEVRRTPLDY